jgi:hypothetical protein
MKLIVVAAIWALALNAACNSKQKPEEIYHKQQEEPPVLLYKQHGVSLYRITDVQKNQTVYFTVPYGETQWTVPGDDDVPPQQFNVNGKK